MFSAMRRRTAVRGTIFSSTPGSNSGAGAVAGAAGAAAGAALRVSMYFRMSCLVTRPPTPVPAMRAASSSETLCSAMRASGPPATAWAALPPGDRPTAALRAREQGPAAGAGAGAATAWAGAPPSLPTSRTPDGPMTPLNSMRPPTVLGGLGAAAAGAGGGSGAAGAADGTASSVSISQMGAPMGIVEPSWAMMVPMTPLTGEGTSMVTLSVSTSTRGSYLEILSPGFLSHFWMVPSVTDSPTCGRSMVVMVMANSLPRPSMRPACEERWLSSPGWAGTRPPGWAQSPLPARPGRRGASPARPASRTRPRR